MAFFNLFLGKMTVTKFTKPYGVLEIIANLLAFVASILMLTALVSPNWAEFSVRGSEFSVGLWQVCKDGECEKAWQYTSKLIYLSTSSEPIEWNTWYYYYETPTIVAVAVATLLIGTVINLLLSCTWVAYRIAAAISIGITSVLYTIGVACGLAIFIGANAAANKPDIQVFRVGYSSICALIALVFAWISFIILSVNVCVTPTVKKSAPIELDSDSE